jgi:septum formation protein
MIAESLVLASASPRRREILDLMGVRHEVVPSGVDERKISADHPRTFALRAAYAKAHDVAARIEPGRWVLAADTVVTRRMVLFGKPTGPENARAILRTLSGAEHDVITGLCLVLSGSETSHLDSELTTVRFRELTEEQICDYVASGEPMDKAGAYGIQGGGAALVDAIDGDYYNVVGLPCNGLLRILDESRCGIAARPLDTPERWKRP